MSGKCKVRALPKARDRVAIIVSPMPITKHKPRMKPENLFVLPRTSLLTRKRADGGEVVLLKVEGMVCDL